MARIPRRYRHTAVGLEPAGSLAGWPSRRGTNAELARWAYGISFSYDSKYLAFPSDQGAMLIELSTRNAHLLQTGPIEKPLFSPTTNLIAFTSASKNAKVHVWDYLANREIGATESGRALWSWKPDGTKLLAGFGGSAFLEWVDVSTLQAGQQSHVVQYVFGDITLGTYDFKQFRSEISLDGRFLAASGKETAALFNAATGECLLSVGSFESGLSSSRFLPDGRQWACSTGSQIGLWDIDSRQKTRSFECGSRVL
jgi:WD40 repeat protein